MAHSRRGFRSRTPGLRRATSWQFGPGDNAFDAFSADATVIIGTGTQILADGLTLVRTRGSLSFPRFTAGSAGDGFVGAHGMVVVSTEAFAAGAAAMPAPLDDADNDGWLVHQFIENISSVAGSGSTLSFDIDSKAMRKLESSDIIAWILQVVEIGVSTGSVQGNSRMLFKLP